MKANNLTLVNGKWRGGGGEAIEGGERENGEVAVNPIEFGR